MNIKLRKLPKWLWIVTSTLCLLMVLAWTLQRCCIRHTDDSLQRLRESGVLRVMIPHNSTDYFIYRGYPMGFQLELVRAFADSMGLELKLVPNNGLTEAFRALDEREIDFLAANVTITESRKERLCFSTPWFSSRQVLVQRSKGSAKRLAPWVSKPQGLAGQSVFVTANSVYEELLDQLTDRQKKKIKIESLEDRDEEELVGLVAEGKIAFTVCSENVARVCQTYFKNIDYSVVLSVNQKNAWVAPCRSDSLLHVLNLWIEQFKTLPDFQNIYRRYYTYPREMFHSDNNYSTEEGHLSSFDPIIRQHADSLHWDWRLLASLIYQESHFRMNLQSWAGAIGLMQMMPAVAKRYGITQESGIDHQVRAGCRYLSLIERKLPKEIPASERPFFVMAAYNAGLGHILDARRLAQRQGLNPNKWFDHVDQALLIKADRRNLKNPLIRHGYARGSETYRFVREIMDRYEHYKNLVQ